MASRSRQLERLTIPILLFYTIPIAVWGYYGIGRTLSNGNWTIFSFALLLIFCGSLLMLLWLNSSWGQPEEVYAELANPLDKASVCKEEDVHEREILSQNFSEALKDKEAIEKQCNDLREKLSSLTYESAQSIEELRAALDQKQQQIVHFENQINDLRYEIKTLLHLTEIDYPQKEFSQSEEESPLLPEERGFFHEHLVANGAEAKVLLKSCLEKAQKITGASQLNSTSRIKAIDHSALDLRLLFDALREENGALIAVFSPKDSKLLFANNQTKSLLGYSPEKFVQEFQAIIQEYLEPWNEAVNQLSTKSELSLPLEMIGKGGESVHVSCHLAGIPIGIFRGLVILVAYAR